MPSVPSLNKESSFGSGKVMSDAVASVVFLLETDETRVCTVLADFRLGCVDLGVERVEALLEAFDPSSSRRCSRRWRTSSVCVASGTVL